MAVVPQLAVVEFPSRVLFTTMATTTIRHRQQCFERYINLLFTIQPMPPDVGFFLEVAQHDSTLHGTRPSLSDQGLSLASSLRSVSMGATPRNLGLPSQVSAQDFELIKVIGQGSFGKVFLVRPRWAARPDEVFAMKVVKKDEVKRRNQMEHTMAERRIMAKITHPFVITLHFAFQSRDKLYMVTEYCQGGELFFHLKRLRRFKEAVMRFYVGEVSLALNHLHTYDIIYRDLKPENILLDQEGHVKLTDFGLSKDHVQEGATKTFCGTPEYLAPEMIINRKKQLGYTKAVDWWSLGIVSFEMLTGWPPFFDRNFNSMCEKILSKPVRFASKYKISPEGQDFIRGLLQREPSLRLGHTADGFQAIRRHPFFRSLNWDDLLDRRVTPPLRLPHNSTADDTRNIDKEFLKMSPHDTPSAPSVMERLTGGGGEHFEDFSFVDQGPLAKTS